MTAEREEKRIEEKRIEEKIGCAKNTIARGLSDFSHYLSPICSNGSWKSHTQFAPHTQTHAD